jgi:hypothetical protein
MALEISLLSKSNTVSVKDSEWRNVFYTKCAAVSDMDCSGSKA